MTFNVQYVASHLFVGGYHGKLCTANYFRCKVKGCPFSLLMDIEYVDGKKIAIACRSAVVPVHDHTTGKRKIEKKHQILNDLKFVHDHPHHPRSLALKNRHAIWNKAARKESRKNRLHLIDIEAVKIYARDHQNMSAVQIKRSAVL